MNILINASTQRVGGGLQVANYVIKAILDYPIHHFVVVTSTDVLIPDCVRNSSHIKIIVFNFDTYTWQLLNGGHHKFLDKIVKDEIIDKVYSIFGPTYWHPKVPHVCGFAYPHYIYKDSPYFTIIPLKLKLRVYLELIIKKISFGRDVDIYITENADVSEKLRILFPQKKVYTVTNYYNPIFDQPQSWDKSINLPAFSGVTLLTIAANYPHKNLRVIKDVVCQLKEMYPAFCFRFVLTAKEDDMPELKGLPNVYFIGPLSINQCPHVYEQATFMFLPTLLECFSASYVEAMRMEVPILTSDIGFARGLCGDAAEFFDPIDAQDIANKIYVLSMDKKRMSTLVENGKKRLLSFDNNEMRIKKYLEILENN